MAESEKVPQVSPTKERSPTSSTVASNVNQVTKDVEHGGMMRTTESLWNYLLADVDPAKSTAPLAMYCFMTGYIDAISFSAIFVWCGFQTGNFAQLALALGRLFQGPPGARDLTFHKADQQALCSLLAFNAGAFVGRISNHYGAHRRLWLIFGTFLQALLSMAGAIAFWKAGQGSIADARDLPVWTNAVSFVGVAFMSASLGVQGNLGKRLNTQFGTTIVLTTVWVELMADPKLFNIANSLIAAVALFLGAFIGRAILQSIGTAGTMGVGAGIRVIISLAWLFNFFGLNFSLDYLAYRAAQTDVL
ncbi:hypothetical protein CPB84DRAFT_1767049 [Gymnopilus junonius]|uniref:DUF1275 domain protein n=1 Tax=Gymnopilus junonius TaxID=109634 RepID=A0A9P5NTI8_GYMJU|nr:hypothetical protein CPB84DRAFT_1767049 [Gymnopilus junonius]